MCFIVLVVVTTYFVRQFSCECIQSYMVICDTIDDFKKETDGTWYNVLIKSEKTESTPPMVTLDLHDFAEVTSLVIVGQVNQMTTEHCHYSNNLMYLSLYDNELKHLNLSIFLNEEFSLRKISFIKNRIQTLSKETFARLHVQVIDLSENLLEVILSDTFTLGGEKNAIEAIIIRKNKLEFIEEHSFPASLKILKLDNNYLTNLQSGVIDSLVNLRGLFISHNKFYRIPNIKTLQNLTTLDISYNYISTVDNDIFKNFSKLQILDLSFNRITKVAFLKPLLLRNSQFLVSLAFNQLNELGLEIHRNANLSLNRLILFGNPWWCHSWTSILKYLNETEMRQTDCDLAYFNSGKFPICVLLQGVPMIFRNESQKVPPYIKITGSTIFSNEDYNKFFVDIKQSNMMSIGCDLSVPQISHLLIDTFSITCVSDGEALFFLE